MSFTGRFGSANSRFGNIEFGADSVENPLEQSVTSTLAFLSEAEANSLSFPLDSTITFAQSASAVIDHSQSVTSTLAFTSTAAFTTIPVASTLALVSSATVVFQPHRSVTDTLAFTQDVNSNIKGATASSTLAFTQDTEVHGPVNESAVSVINFTQEVIGGADYQKSATNTIGFVHVAGRAIEATTDNTIVFTQTAERKNIALSTIVFVSSVSGGKGADPETDLGLTSTAARVLVAPRSASSAIPFLQSATYILERSCTEQNYTPFVGSPNPDFTPPTTTAPTLGHATLTLTYPYTSPTTTLVLRNPEFRNQDTLSFNRINRETRGGTLIVFADPNWPKSQVLKLQVDFLKQSQVDDLLEFFLDSLGKEVGLLDHENRQWRGIILTPDAEITHVGRENRSVQFEFDGALV